MERKVILLKRIRWMTGFFIAGLVLSGITAIPLVTEVDWLSSTLGNTSDAGSATALQQWIQRVQSALHDTAGAHPFLFYGTDWLAFGHLIIALVFVGAWRDPVRNRWLFDFALIACGLVIPWALVFGAIRGIPWYWRIVDCSFGVIGAIPVWYCRRWTAELVRNTRLSD